MRLTHEVFQGPLAVELPLEHEHDKAAEYPGPVWEVHSGVFPDGVDVGVVSDGHGFEDSPDCERISGGINSKGPRAVAIGRQANMLQWGFYGAPDRMTDSGQRVFLNALVYMTKFAGHRPLVKKEGRARSWLEQYIETLAAMPEDKRTSDDGYASYLRKQFAGLAPEDMHGNPEALAKWYAENQEYIYCTGRRQYAVDQDLAQLGLSNRKPKFLDAMLARWKDNPDDELANTLVRRYVGEELARPAKLRAWLEENRRYLFFSDTGGYRWRVDANKKRARKSQGG